MIGIILLILLVIGIFGSSDDKSDNSNSMHDFLLWNAIFNDKNDHNCDCE